MLNYSGLLQDKLTSHELLKKLSDIKLDFTIFHYEKLSSFRYQITDLVFLKTFRPRNNCYILYINIDFLKEEVEINYYGKFVKVSLDEQQLKIAIRESILSRIRIHVQDFNYEQIRIRMSKIQHEIENQYIEQICSENSSLKGIVDGYT